MRVYLDHAATSPVREEVIEVMLPYLTEMAGNASSLHTEGQRKESHARSCMAQHLGL